MESAFGVRASRMDTLVPLWALVREEDGVRRPGVFLLLLLYKAAYAQSALLTAQEAKLLYVYIRAQLVVGEVYAKGRLAKSMLLDAVV